MKCPYVLVALMVVGVGCGGNEDSSGYDYPGSQTTSQPRCNNDRKEGSEVCDGSDHGGLTCASLGLGAGDLLCEPDCSRFDTSGCEGGCAKDCTGRECGPDPVCGFSCGTCTTGQCNAASQCESGCVEDCTGRECGPGPVCGQSCGTCVSGECNASGQCEEQAVDGPRILQFSTNITTMTASDMLVFSAIVTDPDGIEDVIGGVLEDPVTSGVYGSFATSATEGAYSLSLNWQAVNTVRAIDTPTGGGARSFRGRFYDSLGHQTVETVNVHLRCNDAALAVCGGSCRDLMNDPGHCGSCWYACQGPAPSCQEGNCDPCNPQEPTLCGDECADLDTDADHCGQCFQEVVGGGCADGAPYCSTYGFQSDLCGFECVDLDWDEAHCGACDNDCASYGSVAGSPHLSRESVTCELASCFIHLESTSRLSCATICTQAGLSCALFPTDCGPYNMQSYGCTSYDDSIGPGYSTDTHISLCEAPPPAEVSYSDGTVTEFVSQICNCIP